MSATIVRPIGYVNGHAVYPIRGSERGYSTEGDVLVNRTADGTDLNAIWAEFTQALDIYNNHRNLVAGLLGHPVTVPADHVPQSVSQDDFERASEFGVPTGLRAPSGSLTIGYTFEDYDKATRLTWKFLRDADSRQVEAHHAGALEADNRLITTSVLRRTLDPSQGRNEFENPVYGLYNGDGAVPPSYLGQRFDNTHTHYLTTQGDLTGQDLEDLANHTTHHGYGSTPGSQLVALVNPAQGKTVASFKVSDTSPRDFIPSQGAPAYLTPDNLVGQQAPAEFNGLKVAGSYGDVWVVESFFVPEGYVIMVATGGVNSDLNPVGLRKHANVAYQGLRLIPGRDQRYPLVESFYARGFGTGVRHRGAAAVMQVTAEGVTAYTAPVYRDGALVAP